MILVKCEACEVFVLLIFWFVLHFWIIIINFLFVYWLNDHLGSMHVNEMCQCCHRINGFFGLYCSTDEC